MIKQYYIQLLIVTFIAILFQNCAQVVMPTGGPRDVTPPQIEKIVPENNTLNFAEQSIKITFDEFVVLNNPLENVIVSPPVDKEKMKYTLQGKSVIITMPDSLFPNTTYHILFSSCFKDYREGNPLQSLQYTFSTGDFIDQYYIDGRVVQMESGKPTEDCFVFLYTENVDSLPLTTLPRYVSKTDANGYFKLEHIKEGNYKMFALKDINSTLTFDLPNEEIAFSTEMVKAKLIAQVNDTIAQDSIVQMPSMPVDTTRNLLLYSFLEEDTSQYLDKMIQPMKGKFVISLKKEANDISVQLIDTEKTFDYFEQISPTRDSLVVYAKTMIVDSIPAILTYDNRVDTINFTPFKEKLRSRRGKAPESKKLTVYPRHQKELHLPMKLHFGYPVLPLDSAEATLITKLVEGADTSVVKFSIPDTFMIDWEFPYSFKERTSYTLQFNDSLFWGYDTTTHDSLSFQFTVKSVKDYGMLILNVNLAEEKTPHIVYLMKGDKIVREERIAKSSKLVFENLNPNTYNVKVLEDRNNNGKWDTGNYKNKIQPETIIRIDKSFTIRGFWELEETITIDRL